MKNTQTVKQSLLLFGSFGIAYNLAVFLHELSHGLAAILTGGTFSVDDFVTFVDTGAHITSGKVLFDNGATAMVVALDDEIEVLKH